VADTVALLDPELVRPKRGAGWRSILPLLAPAGLLGLTLLAYVRFLGIGFVASDSLPLIDASRLTRVTDVVELFRKPVMAGTPFAAIETVYRPFVSVMFGVEYAVWGLNALGYHLTNLVLHCVSVLVVWRLLALLGLRWWSCVIGAGVFALHPLVVVSVPVIARRDSIVPVTAFMSAWLLLIVAERAVGRARSAALSASVVLAAIALLSKESAFAAVGLLPLLVAARACADGVGWRTALSRASIVAPYVAVAAAVFVVRYTVLGGMGGSADLSEDIPWDRYTQILGAYTRGLIWSFSGLASANHAVWPILAGGLLVGLGVASVYLPRRQAVLVLVGLGWLVSFGVFAMVFRVTTVGWLAYYALPGLAIVWAAGLEGALGRLRARGPKLRLVSATALLVVLAGLGLSWLATSALVRGYDQWQFAGDVSRQYVDALTRCTAASPDVGHVRLDGMPSLVDDGQADTNQLGVTLFEGYTIEAALRLLFPHRELTLTVWSRETLRRVGQTFTLACESDSTRVYLVASY